MISKKRVGYSVFLTCLAFLLLILNVSATNYYSIPIYVSNQSTTAKNPTFSLVGLDTDEITLNFNCNAYISGAGNSVCSMYAPLGNLIATAESSAYGSCVNFGEYEYENTQSISDIESSYFLTSSAGSFYTKTATDIIVTTDDDYLIFSQVDSDKDDSGHVKNFLSNSSFEKETANFVAWKNSMFNMYNGVHGCATFVMQPEGLKNSGWSCDGGGDALWRTYYFMRFFPFNSSESGSIRYDVSKQSNPCNVKAGGSCATGYEIGYFEKGQSETVITTGTSASGELSLTPNSHYVFYIASYSSGKGDGIGVGSCSIGEGDYNSTFNITIITPDWNCSDWSECVNGSQYRTCNDLTGKIIDKIENRFCYSAPQEQIYLGFEDVIAENVWYPYTAYALTNPFCVGCCCDSTHKSVDYPDDWYVENPKLRDLETGIIARQRDFIKMTSDYSWEGDKSLKMWYIPPQNNIPDGYNCTFNTTLNVSDCTYMTCVNQTIGIVPDLRRTFNESVFLEKNITLPTPYMGISFKVRKCIEPELKSPAVLLCHGDKCYTNSEGCGEQVYGRITTYLKNVTTGAFLVDITSDVTYANLWEIREYGIDSLQPNETYTIGFGIIPPYGQVDADCYCIYIDDVNIDIRTQPLICASECIGTTRIQRFCKEYVGDVCVICEQKSIVNSPLCIADEDVIEKVETCEDWCGCDLYDSGHADYYTKFVGTIIEGCNITLEGTEKCCLWTEVENSEFCVGYCTELEEQEEAEETMFTPVVNETEWIESGMPSWALGFLTPVFIAIIIALGFTALVSGKIGERFKTGLPWQFALIVFLTILGVMSLPQVGLFPWWLLLILIIISGAILVKFGGILGGE